MPKFSIVTVNYNNKEALERTLKSVVDQDFEDVQYIVIDGGSTDGSKELITSYASNIDYWVSEEDKGVYEAMNKGLRAANGSYVLFLNSGEVFYETNTLSKLDAYIDGSAAIYYGNLMFVHDGEDRLREYPTQLRFSYFMDRSLPHPGSMIKRSLFDELFYYSEDLKIVADWEFFIYAVCKAQVTYQHLTMVVSRFELDGMSNDPANKKLIEQERQMVLEKHFPLFNEDIKTLLELRKKVGGTAYKLQEELNRSKTTKKINLKIQQALLRLLGGKKISDLDKE